MVSLRHAKLMGNSEATRSANSKSITGKNTAKAEQESKLQGLRESDAATATHLDLIATTIQDLHVFVISCSRTTTSGRRRAQVRWSR